MSGNWFVGFDGITPWMVFVFSAVCFCMVCAQSTTLLEAIQTVLSKTFLGSQQTLLEVQAYLEPRIPKMPRFKSQRRWKEYADRLRKDILERVVFRGEAKKWRKGRTQVE